MKGFRTDGLRHAHHWGRSYRILGCGNPLVLINCKLLAFADRKSTRLNSSHLVISYAVFCLKKKKQLLESTVCSTRSRLSNKLIDSPQPTPLVIILFMMIQSSFCIEDAVRGTVFTPCYVSLV